MTLAIVHGAPEGWDAILLARRAHEHHIAKDGGPLLHAARDDRGMARIAEALAYFAPEIEVLRFPAWDCMPYDRVSPAAALVSERISTLARLLEPPPGPRIVLTTVNALIQRVPPRHVFQGSSRDIVAGGTLKPEELARFLEGRGYVRAGTVMEPGEYAMRGGIIDLFPAGSADPVRLDLFGDQIESIRAFDTSTQRSGAKLERFVLRPVSEVALDPEGVTRFRERWRELFTPKAATDPIYLSISDGRRHPGMEHWVPLFHDRMETLLDYLPGASVSLDHQDEEVLTARLEMIADHFSARKMVARDGEVPYRPLPPDLLYLDRAGWDAMLGRSPVFIFSPFTPAEGAAGIDGGGRAGPVFAQRGTHAQPGSNVFTQLHMQAGRWAAEKRRVILAAWTRGSRERLANLAREHDFKTLALDSWADRGKLETGVIGLITAPPARLAGRRRSSPRSSRWSPSRTCWASASAGPRAAASAPTSSSPRRPRSPRATWWCIRTTASRVTTAW